MVHGCCVKNFKIFFVVLTVLLNFTILFSVYNTGVLLPTLSPN